MHEVRIDLIDVCKNNTVWKMSKWKKEFWYSNSRIKKYCKIFEVVLKQKDITLFKKYEL